MRLRIWMPALQTLKRSTTTQERTLGAIDPERFRSDDDTSGQHAIVHQAKAISTIYGYSTTEAQCVSVLTTCFCPQLPSR